MNLEQFKRKYMAEGFRKGWKHAAMLKENNDDLLKNWFTGYIEAQMQNTTQDERNPKWRYDANGKSWDYKSPLKDMKKRFKKGGQPEWFANYTLADAVAAYIAACQANGLKGLYKSAIETALLPFFNGERAEYNKLGPARKNNNWRAMHAASEESAKVRATYQSAGRKLNSKFDKDLIRSIYQNWMLEIIGDLGGDSLDYFGEEEMGLEATVEQNGLSKQDVISAMNSTMDAAVAAATTENGEYWREEWDVYDIEDEVTTDHIAAAKAKIQKVIMKLGV